METILIFRQPDVVEWKAIEKQVQQICSRVVTAPGIVLPISGISFTSLPAEITRKANQELLDSILLLGDKNTGDESLSEVLNSVGLPIWHYQRFRIFFILRPLFLLRYAIAHFLNQGSHVSIYCDAAHAPKLVDFVEKISLHIGKPKKKPPVNFTSFFNYIIYFKIKVLLDLLHSPDLRNSKHVFIDRSLKQLCRHIDTLELKYDNYTLSALFDKAGEDSLIISETEPPKFRGNGTFRLSAAIFAGSGRQSRTISGEYILFRGVISRSLYKERKQMISELDSAIARLKSIKFTDSEAIIFNSFLNLSKTNAYFITRFLAYRRFFRRNKFLTISSIDENSPSARCILDAARSTGSKTIGIQHGNIGDAQPAYLYTEKDRKNGLMADLTLVWGEYWREFLVSKGNFPAGSVRITGQIRTDIIPKLLSHPDELKNEFGVKKPIAVFASQPIPDPYTRRKAASEVFKSFSELPGYELFVKLHPAERDSVNYYREIAENMGCTDYRIVYDVDLYSLLAASSLVITCYSTVGTEAIYFGKPLIILDPMREDLLGYHKAGVAWQALNSDDLTELARGILTRRLEPDMDAYRRFIEKYSYRIDGQATVRTLAILNAVKSGTAH